MLKSVALCIASAAILAGCASRTAPPAAPAAPAIDQAATAAASGYVQSASSAGQFEIQASQLALQMSQSPAVRAYAQMLINDHSQLASRLAAAAQSAGVAAPAMMLPQHASLMSQLQYAAPGQFDGTYRNIIVMTQMQAIDAHQGYAATGALPPLREFAASAAPLEQMHLSQAQALTIETPRMRVPSSRRAGERG
jgi:putative membrane protein